MIWQQAHPQFKPEMLGFIPSFLSESDPRPAREQIAANYAHGGGWSPIDGFSFPTDGKLKYPGDPPYAPLAISKLRKEVIVFFDYSLLMIMQPDGSYEVARLD